MMSSEEDTDSFGLYSSDNKSSLLIKTNLNKTLGLNNNQYNFKRNRQRVDAGEPRNTYTTNTSVLNNNNSNNTANNNNNNSNCNNSNSNNNLTAETVLTTLTNLMSSAGGAVAAQQQQSYGALNNNINNNSSNNNNCLSSTNTASSTDPLAINNNSSSSPQLSLSPSGQLPTSSTLSSTTTTSTSSPTLSSTTSSTSAAVAAAAQLVGGLFGPNGFGSAKMLNELFGRQMKQAQDATSGLPSATQQMDNSLLAAAIETATSNDLLNVNAINGSGKDSTLTNNTNTMSANTNGSATAQMIGGGPNSPILINNNNNTADQTNTELAHHMLRNILQGKKELLNSLDPEIRSVFNSASGNGGGILTPRTTPTGAVESNNSENNNNNIINNNKNYTNGAGAGLNNLLNNCIEPMLTQIKSEPSLNSNSNSKIDNNGQTKTNPSSMQNGHHHNQHHISDEQSDDEGKNSLDMKKESTDDLLDDEMMVALNSNGSDIESLGSPHSSQADELMKNELEAEIEKDSAMSSGQNSKSSEKIDLKRARVENIVSSMRSSPSSSASHQNQVNGCKKRKLYQPQQHDQQTAMERYAAVAQAAAGLNFAGFNMQNLIMNNHIDAEDESQSIQSPQLQQKRVEKNALESQLRSMKERLAEMEQQYVQLCSRLERESECHDLDDTSTGSLEQDMDIPSPSPPLPQQSMNENSSPNQQPQRPLNRHISPLKDNKANQMLLENTPTQMLTQMMSKMMSNSQRHPHFNGAPHPLLQQFGGPHVPVPTDPSSHLPHPLSNALFLGQKFLLEQQAAAKEAAAEHERQAAAVQQEQQRQQQEHQRQIQQQQQQQQQQEQHRQQQNAKKSEITDKFNNMLRRNSPASSMSGNELEGLADILKSEILSSISSLVDTILSRYSHQRSLFNKQTDAVQAAAEQFNKDLQLAAHIVDRKSPRTKVACESRSSGKRSPTIQQANQTGNGPLLTNNQLHLTNSTNSSINNNQSNSTNISSNNSNINNNNLNLNNNSHCNTNDMNSNVMNNVGPRMNGSSLSMQQMHHQLPTNLDSPSTHLSNATNNCNNNTTNNSNSNNSNNNSNLPPPHVRPSPSAAMFQTPKPPQHQGVSGGPVMNPVAAAALYNSMNALGGGPSNGHHHNQVNPFCLPPEPQNMREPTQQEQNEALSLVVQPKKKRHKVTDTRITPRTISRVLAQDGMGPGNNHDHQPSTSFNKPNVMQQQHQMQPPNMNTTPAQSPSPRSSNMNNQQQQQSQQFHQQQPPPPPPGSMLPVSLPTSVAIPNPSLHESQVFSPYSPFFNPHGPHGSHGGLHAPPNQFNHIKMSSSPPGLSGMMVGNGDSRDSPPLPHPPTMLHPALLAHAAHHGNSPDYSAHLRAAMDAQDRNSDCNSGDMQFDGIQPTISFLKRTMKQNDSLSSMHSSTLTPMHLRKAKLMFFWVRYPSSAVLKMYFPDIKFNKNNTAQLVKWFSNFREFYYIQMEKYARQANTDGVQSCDDLQVTHDSELYRHLNLHYNRNNHIEVPNNFRFVVEQTLKEFFRSIQGGKDTEQSWKKSIYKIISRMDDPVPEYFKSPNFLEQLE